MHQKLNALAAKAKDGDKAALVQLVEHSYAAVYAFLRRLTSNEPEAEDLTQKTYVQVFRSLPMYAGRSSVSSWIHGIAYHCYLDWLRGNHRRPAGRPDDWWEALSCAAETPDDLVRRADETRFLYDCVEKLERPLKETVHLHYFQELTLQETAEAMGVAVSTVKYRLNKALSELERSILTQNTRCHI